MWLVLVQYMCVCIGIVVCTYMCAVCGWGMCALYVCMYVDGVCVYCTYICGWGLYWGMCVLYRDGYVCCIVMVVGVCWIGIGDMYMLYRDALPVISPGPLLSARWSWLLQMTTLLVSGLSLKADLRWVWLPAHNQDDLFMLPSAHSGRTYWHGVRCQVHSR